MPKKEAQPEAPKRGDRRWALTADAILVGVFASEVVLLACDRFGWLWLDEKKGWPVLIVTGIVSSLIIAALIWFSASVLLRWRFQFRIRTLLFLTLVVAVPCAWLV